MVGVAIPLGVAWPDEVEPYVSTPSFEMDDAGAEAGVAFGEGAMAGAAAVAL